MTVEDFAVIVLAVVASALLTDLYITPRMRRWTLRRRRARNIAAAEQARRERSPF